MTDFSFLGELCLLFAWVNVKEKLCRKIMKLTHNKSETLDPLTVTHTELKKQTFYS